VTRPPLKGVAVPEPESGECPQCNVATQPGAYFCGNGHPVRCRTCGAPVRDARESCGYCGAALGAVGLATAPPEGTPGPPLRTITSQGAEPLAVPLDVVAQTKPAPLRTPSEPEALPELRSVYFELGLAVLAAGRVEDAVDAFRRALEEPDGPPEQWEVEFHLGRALDTSEQDGEAARAYLAAAADSQERVGTLLPFAHALLTPETATLLQPWLEEDWLPRFGRDLPARDHAEILLFVGRANLWAQQHGRAREAFLDALSLAPRDARLVEGLGEAQWRTNELDEALASFEQARDLAATRPDRLTAIESKIAGVLVSLGRYRDALERIEDILARSDRYAHELELNRAQCYLALDRPAEALVAGDEARGRRPGTVAPHVVRAQAMIALHRYAEAVTEVDAAMRLDPTRRSLMFCKAQALVEGQIDLDQADRLLARCAEGKSRDEVIPRSLVPGLKARSSDGNLEFFLAVLHRLLGRPEEAFEHVHRALELGLTADTSYPEAPAYLLKAELLEALDRRPESGEYFLHAGSRVADSDAPRAIELLKKAVAYSPDPAEAHWYLADAYLSATATSEPPYVDADYLRKGLEAWKRAYDEVGPPRAEWAWAYLTAAILLENATKLGREAFARLGVGESYEDVWWTAVSLVERSLLLDPHNGYALALLTGYFRYLDRYANALQASGRAVELERTSRELGPRAATLVELGYVEAGEVVEEYLQVASPSELPWGSMLKGYLLTGQDEFADSIRHFDDALEADPDEPLYLFHRGRTLSLAAEVDRARRDFERLLAVTEPGQPFASLDNLQHSAWAAFALGRYADAKQILLGLVEEFGEGDHEVEVAVAWCYLGLGQIKEADTWFKRALGHAVIANEFHETLQDLEEFERRLKGDGRRRELKRLATYRRRLEEKRKELPDRLDDESHALAELQAVADAAPAESAAGVGSRAALGRVYGAAGRWREAASAYSALAQRGSDAPLSSFPEAELGLAESIDEIVTDTEFHAAAGETEEALAALSAALELVESLPPDASRRAELLTRIGYARFALSGDVAGAREAFTTALELHRKQGVEDPGEALGEILVPLVRDSRSFWELDHRWDSLVEGAEPTTAEGFESARASLLGFLDQRYGLTSAIGPYREGVVVELGEHVVPEDTSPTGPLLGTYMPALREELLQTWVFEPPGVLFRPSGDPSSPNGYAIRVDGVLAARGKVWPALRFARVSPVVARAIVSEVVEQPDPVTGILGSWVDDADAERLETAGNEVLETPLNFVLRHLHQVLRLNVAELLGLQETEAVIRAWTETDAKPLLDELSLDLSTKVRLAGLLRTLARDGVPLAGREILEAVHDTGLDPEDTGPTVRLIRLALKQHLPGNKPGDEPVDVPPEWESRLAPALQRVNGRLRLEASPGELLAFSAEIGRWLDPGTRGLILVTADGDARPFLQRLVRDQYPLATVLAADEVVRRPDEAPAEASAVTRDGERDA
jgi:tetratricopeptide (TPR) repeat protein